MKVFTFYDAVDGKREPDELALIDLWKRSWSAMGWEPTLLSGGSLSATPESRRLRDRLNKLPSVNKRNLDLWCYLRWLAVAERGGGFMADYDVINYAFVPRPPGRLTTHERFVPCVVSGTAAEFRRAVEWFAEQKVSWIERNFRFAHTSDMLVMKARQSEFDQTTECVEYGEAGWESAPLVHYCNRAMKPGNLMPRHRHIEKLRPLPGLPADD